MHTPIFSLIDCNNFYASCERVFNFKLENVPIVVLSNNDGCVIARSNEAKKLQIPMGAPFHQFRDFFQKNKVKIFSSNYALYGDMSSRVMTTLKNLCPNIEIYSIDEAFLRLDGFEHLDLFEFGLTMKRIVKRHTGIPVSVGFAPTKTLAKIANHIAKKKTIEGVFSLCDANLREQILADFPIEDIWGIGRQHAKKLTNLGIKTAKDLRDVDPKDFRKLFSVVMERTIQELRGNPCLQLDDIQPRKQIISSRSFGKPILNLADLSQALAFHVTKASERLRKQKSRASGLYLFIHTNPFALNKKQYSRSMIYTFPEHAIDTGYILHCASQCLERIYKPGYEYHKLGVMLLDLVESTIHQQDLFLQTSQKNTLKREKLMEVVDSMNSKYGRGTMRYALEGYKHSWGLRSNYRSSRYTTCLDEVLNAWCK